MSVLRRQEGGAKFVSNLNCNVNVLFLELGIRYSAVCYAKVSEIFHNFQKEIFFKKEREQ